MNLTDMLLGADNSSTVNAIARQLGIGEQQAKSAMAQVLPAVAKGLQRNAQSPSGLESLMGALARGNHGRYLRNPDELASSSGLADGKAILGHVFGSKDVSRQVADGAAQRSGLSADTIKQMLPMIAAAAMGALGQRAEQTGAIEAGTPQAGRGATDLLGSLLDSDGDGSIADDLLGMAGKFFR